MWNMTCSSTRGTSWCER